MHIKKDDIVVVISGGRSKAKENGKKGKVLAVFPKENRVIVEGINMRTKHKKAQSAETPGGIMTQEGKIDASNVLLYCDKCKKGVRTGVKVLNDKSKVRVCRKCGETLDK